LVRAGHGSPTTAAPHERRPLEAAARGWLEPALGGLAAATGTEKIVLRAENGARRDGNRSVRDEPTRVVRHA
jgi:hypothetical protein